MSEGELFKKLSKVVEDAEQAGWDGSGGNFDPKIVKVLQGAKADFPNEDNPKYDYSSMPLREFADDVKAWREKWLGQQV